MDRLGSRTPEVIRVNDIANAENKENIRREAMKNVYDKATALLSVQQDQHLEFCKNHKRQTKK